MPSPNSNREPGFGLGSVLSAAGIGANRAEIILATGEVDHGRIAEDQTQLQQTLRDHTVVIVAIDLFVSDGASGSKPCTAEAGTLQGNRIRKPALHGCSEVQCR